MSKCIDYTEAQKICINYDGEYLAASFAQDIF